MKHIAQETGLSVPTVSYILNSTKGHRFNEQTRQRVTAVAQRLGYRPSAAARAIRSQATRQIGVIVRLHPVAMETLIGINAGLSEAGLTVSIVPFDHTSADTVESRAFTERMFDGFVVLDEAPEQVMARLVDEPHTVWVNTNVWREQGCLQRDEAQAGRLAANAIINAGWERICFVSGRVGEEAHYSSLHRAVGVREAAEAAGVAMRHVVCDEVVTDWRNLDVRLGELLPGEAMLFSDSYLVRTMQNVLIRRGLMPGRDLTLACCDHTDEFNLVWPELARVWFNRDKLGREAAAMLVHSIQTGSMPDSRRTVDQWYPGETIFPATPAGHAGLQETR